MTTGINTDPSPQFVDVTLLKYQYRFKRLYWREELNIKIDKGLDPVRVVLAYALQEVSGLKINSPEEGARVINAIPEAIKERVWMVYKGSLPPARRFSTASLYKAPEPTIHAVRIEEEEMVVDAAHERAMQEMEQKFGKQEVAEEMELSRKILAAAQKNGKPVGATPATPEGRERGQNRQ